MPTNSKTPSSTAAAVAEDFGKRTSKRSEIPIRYGFVSRESETDSLPPLVHILRTKRGAKVRLALYLSYIYLAAAVPHDIRGVPAHFWATLLGLDDPEGNGARQIRSANTWLAQHNLIQIIREPGNPSTIVLLNETGNKEPYTLPGLAHITARKSQKDLHRYFKLPADLWTQGWIAKLSAAAIAMLLVLFESTRGGNETHLWHAGSVTRNNYGISESLRSSGLQELTKAGLISFRTAPISRSSMSSRRTRNVYRINRSAIASPPSAFRTMGALRR